MSERAHPDDKGFKDRFWGLRKNPYRDNLQKRYEFCSAYIRGKRVLDVPCGMGWGTSMLDGVGELFGVDRARNAIKEAKVRYPNIKFSVGDMTSLDFPGEYFDVVICLEGFEHITFLDGLKFLKEIRRVLKDKGMLIMTTPLLREGKYHSGNIYHLCEYREDELDRILKDFAFKPVYRDQLNSPERIRIVRMVLEKQSGPICFGI